MNSSNVTNNTYATAIEDGSKTTNGTETDDYDSEGAMKFIIATVLVYSVFGVFCTLLSRIKRGRGRSHQIMVQDENVSKYLKKSKTLQVDGYKMKLMYECSKYTALVQNFEEKMIRKELEKEMSTLDYVSSPLSTQRPGKSKKKDKRKMSGLGAVGKMGLSLFYMGDLQPSRQNSAEHMPTVTESGNGETEALNVPRTGGGEGPPTEGTSQGHTTVKAVVVSPQSRNTNNLNNQWSEDVKIKSKSDMSIKIQVEDFSSHEGLPKKEKGAHSIVNSEVSCSTRSLETGL